MLLVPTAGTIYTVAEVEMEPIRLNTNLGYYTNFANLLDLCGLAVPNGFQQNGLPMGITLLAPAFQEARLAAVGSLFQAARTTTLGATTCPHLQLLSDIT
jgi:allophanate hydrolase